MWRQGEGGRQPKSRHKLSHRGGPPRDGPLRGGSPRDGPLRGGPKRKGPGTSSCLLALSVAVFACADLVQGAARPGSARDPPTVDIRGQGIISGREVIFSRTQKATLYLNIPFAQPPIDDLRFAPPKTDPLPTWSDIRNGSSFGPACMQDIDELYLQDKIFTTFYNNTGKINISEDCLTLNVFVPDGTKPADGWPVMLWLHSGDFNTGAACLWDGSVLALRQRVVVVTTNYRLNVFGFFTTLDGNAAGNWGLWDQKAAIKWVRDKIRNFGGNSDAITIFGHGAGAVSVGIHMISKESLGFHGAIAMSGSSASLDYYMTVEEQAKKVLYLSQEFQCNPSTNDTVPCLRGANSTTILKQGLSTGKWGPVIDITNVDPTKQTHFLSDMPDKLLLERNSAVPFITGFTNHEDAFKVEEEAKTINENILYDKISKEIQNEVLKPTTAYKNDNSDASPGALEQDEELEDEDDDGIEPTGETPKNDTCVISKQPLLDAAYFYYSPVPSTNDSVTLKQIYAKFLTDKKYASNVYKQAYTNSRTRPTYLYRFDYRIKSNNVGTNAPDWAGVPHMYELPFVWGTPYSTLFKTEVLWNSADKKIADNVMGLFGSFARSVANASNAAPQGATKWEPFKQNNPTLLIIDKALNMSDQESVDFRAFSFWTEYYPTVRDNLMTCCNENNGAVRSHLRIPSPLLSEFFIHIPLLLPIIVVFY